MLIIKLKLDRVQEKYITSFFVLIILIFKIYCWKEIFYLKRSFSSQWYLVERLPFKSSVIKAYPVTKEIYSTN
jgi:hypothetical protein